MLNDTRSLRNRSYGVFPGGVTRSTVFVPPHPPYAVGGKGAYVTDDAGRELIDCNNNYTALIHGNADPDILQAVFAVAATGTAFGLPTPHELDLAEVLKNRVGLDHWRFCNSGTEAVMMLLRAARAATGRDLVIRFDGSYHGTSDAVVSPAAPGVPKDVENSILILPQADTGALETAFEQHGARIAAVLIDLMPNRAGLVPATQEYVDSMVRLARDNGALVAVDEVISFRLGYGGLHRSYGLRPDLMSLGKVIGGGFPVGAIGGRAEVMAHFDPRQNGSVIWGGTFSANPVSMVAGLAALEKYGEPEIERINHLGDRLRHRLNRTGLKVSGHGSLVRVLADDTSRLWWSLYQHGVLTSSSGLIALSTPMDEALVDEVAERVIAASDACSNG